MLMKKMLALLMAIAMLCFASAYAEDPAAIKAGDLVCMGIQDDGIGFDCIWRVLDADQTSTGEPGMFLLCESLIGGATYFREETSPTTNAYAGSDAQQWCAAFFEAQFTEAEKEAILPTYKSDDAYARVSGLAFMGNPTVHFDAAPEILRGDKVFLLSAEEADQPAYGFADDNSRIAYYQNEPANWWLRSPHDPSFPIDVGVVYFSGWLLDFYENMNSIMSTGPVCMRPAFNLDTTCIRNAEKTDDGVWHLGF